MAEPRPAHAGSAPDRESKAGILVVDDDPMLLSLLRLALVRQGLEVWTCPSGSEALDRYRTDGGRIGLVLLDVCMPGLDGPATLAELRRLNPDVQACFMSGFLGEHTATALQELGAVRFYEKPFRLEAMSAELSELARGAA